MVPRFTLWVKFSLPLWNQKRKILASRLKVKMKHQFITQLFPERSLFLLRVTKPELQAHSPSSCAINLSFKTANFSVHIYHKFLNTVFTFTAFRNSTEAQLYTMAPPCVSNTNFRSLRWPQLHAFHSQWMKNKLISVQTYQIWWSNI